MDPTLMSDFNLSAVANFIFELAQLREKPRSGWELIKVPEKESVANHVLRMTQLAYILAVMEGHPEPEQVAMCALFHENGETRLPDIHKVAARYLSEVREENVVIDQTAGLGVAGEKILAFWRTAEHRSSAAGIIAKDADYLECAFTAKEYLEQGHVFAANWIDNVRAALKTDSAKQLFGQMLTMTSNDWWQGLKKLS